MNALSNTVMDTWNNGHLEEMITKVLLCLKRVLLLIIEANGKNDLVEKKRDQKYANLDLPIDLTDDDDVPDIIPAAKLYDKGVVLEEEI